MLLIYRANTNWTRRKMDLITARIQLFVATTRAEDKWVGKKDKSRLKKNKAFKSSEVKHDWLSVIEGKRALDFPLEVLVVL